MTAQLRDENVGQAVDCDRRWAFKVLAVLWAAVLFVFLMVLPFANTALAWTMGLGGGALLAYNTVSMLGLIGHPSREQDAGFAMDAASMDRLPK
jgi:hypothetical protein